MNRNEFLRAVVVLDTETTNLYPEQAEIVEVAGARYDGSNWNVKSMLLGAKDGIPPEASAKNHISNRMIAGLRTFAEVPEKVVDTLTWNESDYTMYVAHNAKYDQTVLEKAWNSCDGHWKNHASIATDPCRWICTYRLAKQLLDFDFADMRYNLPYLRYKLDLEVPDDMPSHRGGTDTLTCALLFEFLIDYAIISGRVVDNDDFDIDIFGLALKPIAIKKWPFGKHKGVLLSDVPTSYYSWAITNLDSLNEKNSSYDYDLAETVKAVLEKRLA